jgi:hypothetical protein
MEFIKINVNLSRAKVTVANFGYPFGPFGLLVSEDFNVYNLHLSRAQVTVADFGYPFWALWLACF